MKKLRIFISSPGDVQQERMIAKRVISDLGRIYQDYVVLEPILWEDLPLEATGSFQGGIDYFLNQAPIDIAVFILWSRLGSKLGSAFRREDGTEYESGTEYEFDMMYTLWERTQRPKLMVYIKDAEPQFVGTPSHIKDLISQKDKLDQFIEQKFRDRETGTNYAYWQFDKQQTFEERLRTHLKRLITDQIGEDVTVREWDGNPYVGLRSYSMEESTIFCGRKGLIYDIVGKLMPNDDNSNASSLFVLGESGSGKSSLIKAGVLPQLLENSWDGKTFCAEVVTPSSFRGHVYDGIVELVLKHFPALSTNPVASDLENGISDNYDFKYLRHALSQSETKSIPIIFFDQFEELFTDNLITDEERKRTLHLLRGLCETQQVVLIFSMRNDFYSRFTSYPELGVIKNISFVVDVPNVSPSDIAEIVEEPARKANKRWARDEKGISLSKRIIEDASRLQSLPLIEFALSELYNECADTDEMTFEAYHRIGSLNGAVVQYANDFYASLTPQEQEALKSILGAVITVSDGKDTIFVRKTSVRSNVEKTDAQRSVIQKLIDAHLFVSGKDSNGEATISFIHEILLTSWDVVKDWCIKHKDFLDKNDHYEKLAGYWKTNGRQKKDLIQERSALLEAEYFMFLHENALQPNTYDYLHKSLLKQRRKGLVKHIVFFLVVSLLSFFFIYGLIYKEELDDVIQEMYDSLSWYDAIFQILPLLLVSLYAIYLRIDGRPKYKTITTSAIIWTCVIVVLFLYVSISSVNDKAAIISGLLSALLGCLPFIFCWASVLFEFKRRKQWKKHIYKTYALAYEFEIAKDIIVYLSIAAAVLWVIITLFTEILERKEELEERKKELEEKNAIYEKTLIITDNLFSGLNEPKVKENLECEENLYINKMRKNYLEERFITELLDTVPDTRESEYATCLYNLHDPYEALKYLYPDHFWSHHCMYIVMSASAGLNERADFVLEKYIEGRHFDENWRLDAVSWITPTELIWTAEKLGRFDLADSLYNVLEENNFNWYSNPSNIVNYGHIKLMNGNITEALEYYREADHVGTSGNPSIKEAVVYDVMSQSVQDDFAIFRWLDVGNQAYIDEAATQLGFSIRPFYTHKSDFATSGEIHEQLVGTWTREEQYTINEIIFDPAALICQYRTYVNDEEIFRTHTNCRYSQADGKLYWEELNPDTGKIASGEIISLTDSEFSVKIIENGNPEDKGTIQTYHKIKEEG